MEVDHNFAYLDKSILENLIPNAEKYTEVSKEVAKDIQTKKITILEVIKKLECLLLCKSFEKRESGILLLGEALKNIPDGSLNVDELSVLSSYFSEKLKDHHQVAKSALKGVLALLTFSNITSESVVQLVSHIFSHIACQQQQQEDRYLIFQIYETVLKQHTNEVHSMGIDFVYGVISSIDGERDPKNLIYLFNWLQIFLKTVKLSHLTEEMFDVLSCYFPVDYKAPPSVENRTSREDLAKSLCKCLTCIAEFGQYSLPLALEKLDSALKIAKYDSLDVLKEGCINYEIEIYNQHSIEIWSQIQKEVFTTSDAELKLKCLETFKEIIAKLSKGDQKNFESTVLDIADALRGNILPDSKLFNQSSQILIYMAKASKTSSILVAKKVAPLLENTFKMTINPKHRVAIFRNFIDFVEAVIDTNELSDLNNVEEIANCPSLCGQAIVDTDPDLIIEGYRGFTAIIQYIPENSRQTYLQALGGAVIAPSTNSVKRAVLKSLKRAAELFPQDVERFVLRRNSVGDTVAIDNYLQGLSSMIKLEYFEDSVIEAFLSYASKDVSSSTLALKHLSNVLSESNHIAKRMLEKSFVTRLTDFLVELSDAVVDKVFLNGLNSVFQSVLRNQDAFFQKETYLIQSSRSFNSQNVYSTVLSGLIVPLRRGVFEDYDKIDFLIECSLNGSEDFVRNIPLEVLANVLNKIDNEPVLEEKLNKIRILCDNCDKVKRIWVTSWITKSLVTRNHPKAWQWADLLFDSLKNNDDAAKGFRIVTDETNKVISIENYCQIMPLYKQKFFNYCTNKLNVNYQNNGGTAELNAVGYLIENAPKVVVLGHFRKISRLILLCLEKSTDSAVLEILVQRINELITSGESVIEDSLEDILFRVLNLTTFEGSMAVRISAVRCLHQITINYKVYKLLPYKHRVIHQLGMCVDDRKRLVRREAMELRSLWYLIDAPE